MLLAAIRALSHIVISLLRVTRKSLIIPADVSRLRDLRSRVKWTPSFQPAPVTGNRCCTSLRPGVKVWHPNEREMKFGKQADTQNSCRLYLAHIGMFLDMTLRGWGWAGNKKMHIFHSQLEKDIHDNSTVPDHLQYCYYYGITNGFFSIAFHYNTDRTRRFGHWLCHPSHTITGQETHIFVP
jgi:hypothetical protein